MSLMNDALRKRKNEKKHPPGTEFLKDDSEKKSISKFKRYGIAAIVLLVFALAGYYFYEMISLSRPMAPVQQSPLLADSRVSPPEEPVSSVQEYSLPESSETAIPADRMPDKQVSPPQAMAAKPPLPAPASEIGKGAPAGTPQKTVKELPPNKIQEPARPEKTVPEPVIEPEEASLQPESAGNADLNQTESVVTAADTGPDPVQELFYRKGLSYHRQNKLEMAIQMYQMVLKKNPHHPSTRFNLASAYIQVGAFTQARTILEELNQQEPGNPDILLNLAAAEIGLDRPEQALTFLESAEKEFAAPTFEILFHKGVAHSRMGDFETALTMYKKAERLAPENPRLWLNTAIVYDSMVQYDQAIDYYQMFLGRNTSLTTREQREIQTRVRELKAYLSQEDSRPAANPQTESEQAE